MMSGAGVVSVLFRTAGQGEWDYLALAIVSRADGYKACLGQQRRRGRPGDLMPSALLDRYEEHACASYVAAHRLLTAERTKLLMQGWAESEWGRMLVAPAPPKRAPLRLVE
jgi:hypothetical protein